MSLSGLQKGVELIGEAVLGHSSHALVLQLAVLEEEDGGDVTDAEAGGDVGAFLDVGFADSHAAIILLGDFVDYGGELLARPTPGGAEVDHDYRVVFENLIEVLVGDIQFHD